mmetsp:Transcript_9873/g.15806  ORF Transcript_9873/g.15806 Transcript_9873/m.15806 type:complete len:474 (+) Transcript_9873:81-1502(+)
MLSPLGPRAKRGDQRIDLKMWLTTMEKCFKNAITLGAEVEQTWSKTDNEASQFTLKNFAPTLAAIAFMGMLLFMNAALSREADWSVSKVASELMWKNASVRPPLMIIVAIAGWAWVVRVCRASAMNLESVLGGIVQPYAATFHSALVLVIVLLVARDTHLIAAETPGLTWRPWLTCNMGLHVVFIVLALLPLPALQRESRASLVRTLYESAIAPFAPVTFWHVIVADYLTSLAKTFSDIQMAWCVAAHIFLEQKSGQHVRSEKLWGDYHDHCTDSYSNMLMLALPFWFRLMQCLKVYSQTKEQKNLWNALKYTTAFPLVYAGYLRNQEPSPEHTRFFIFSAVVQSSFTFVWDILMDWGLPERPASVSIRSCFGFGLRERTLVSRQRHIYVSLCVGNFLLRFAWTLSTFGGIASHGVGMFFFEFIEIIRRTVWAVFRIEWELVRNADKRSSRSSAPDDVELEETTTLVGKALDT